jgi:membrane protein
MAVVRLVQGPRRGGRHGLFGVTGTLVAMSQDDRPQDDRPQGLARRFLKDVSEHDVGGLSAEMAYRFLFAVFPFGLFVAALGAVIAGWLRVDDPAGQIVGALGDNLPAEIANAVRPELERLLTTARTDLVLLGALAALWAATGGTNALSKGIHRAYGVEEQRPFVLRYAVAIGLTLLGAVGIIAAFVTIIGGAMVTEQVAEELGLGTAAWTLLQWLRWPAVFLFLIAAVAILYRYASSVVVPWRWIIAGAAVFAGGWLLATAGLALYVMNFADYGATYGSLGGVIALMLWFYVTAVMLVVGAEVTALLARERSPESIRRRGEEVAAAQVVDGATHAATRKAGQAVGRPSA